MSGEGLLRKQQSPARLSSTLLCFLTVCRLLRANECGRECLMRVHAKVLIARQFGPRCPLGAECAFAHEHVTAIVRATQLFELSRGQRGRASEV